MRDGRRPGHRYVTPLRRAQAEDLDGVDDVTGKRPLCPDAARRCSRAWRGRASALDAAQRRPPRASGTVPEPPAPPEADQGGPMTNAWDRAPRRT